MDAEWLWAGACLALLLYLGYELRNRRSLSRWLQTPSTPDPPRARGAWDRLHALIVRMNRATNGSMVVPSEYLEVVITKR